MFARFWQKRAVQKEKVKNWFVRFHISKLILILASLTWSKKSENRLSRIPWNNYAGYYSFPSVFAVLIFTNSSIFFTGAKLS